MILVPMGVAGCGKTTVGKLLAERLDLDFLDADDLHPAANIEKMASGIPLTDDDREPWLDIVRQVVNEYAVQEKGLVIACSALKERYRQAITGDRDVTFIFLKGGLETIRERMKSREHFMRPEMLQSQFDALEEPSNCIIADIEQPPPDIVETVCSHLSAASVE